MTKTRSKLCNDLFYTSLDNKSKYNLLENIFLGLFNSRSDTIYKVKKSIFNIPVIHQDTKI